MEYRKLGHTGMEVSVVGLGAEHLDGASFAQVDAVVNAALDHGMNIIDVFMPGDDIRGKIGRSLRGKRDKVIIQGMFGSVDLNKQYDMSRDLEITKRYFENLLRQLRTDYIDCGLFFYVDTEEILRQIQDNGIVQYARDLKRQGVIRAIGASSHNPLIARRLVDQGLVEMMLFSINPAFDMTPNQGETAREMVLKLPSRHLEGMDPARASFYLACQKAGVGLTVMKSLGAGKLLSPAQTPFSQAMTVAQCIQYALDRPAVASVLPGCRSVAEVEAAAAYLTTPAEERRYEHIIAGYTGVMQGECVYCNHCQPCPQTIDIAALSRYLDLARVDLNNVPAEVRQGYNELAARGSDCIQCGACEERCPFGVTVIDNMAQAAAIFGS